MAKTIVAVFNNQDNAQRAAEQIKEQGLRTDDISIVAKQAEEGNGGNMRMQRGAGGENSMEMKNDNISNGLITGGILGGAAGLLIGAGSIGCSRSWHSCSSRSYNRIIIRCCYWWNLGSLIDLGIPKIEVKIRKRCKRGKILFSMKVDEDKIDEISSILRNNMAESVNITKENKNHKNTGISNKQDSCIFKIIKLYNIGIKKFNLFNVLQNTIFW